MAEYVCHAVIRHFREFAAYERQAGDAAWVRRPSRSRSDFTIGVLGLGVLGTQVAQALRQFAFPVQGWSRSARVVDDGIVRFDGAARLPEFLAASRVLVNLLPLTADTRDMLDHARLSLLPRGAYLVNVARGEHLVDADLLALLDAGHLAGATLDVFRAEPLPAEHAFWRHPAVTVTPHISAQTLREESIAQIAGKILALERGEPVAGIVDPRRGY
jgi:glyoxylate/hydroxypyruvate reductase A